MRVACPLLQATFESHSFREEPSSWYFIFSRTFYTSFILTLITHLVASPMIAERYILDVYSKLDKKGFLISLPGSTVHAVIISFTTCYMLLTGAMGTNLVYSKSQLGFTVLQLSLRYFVADFVFCCMDSNLRWEKASMVHHMAVIIGVWPVLYFQGKFMFFVIFRYISKLSMPVVNILNFGSSLSSIEKGRLCSRDLNNNGCGIFSLSDTSHLVVLDEPDSSANGPCLYHCVVVCQSVDSLHLRCI